METTGLKFQPSEHRVYLITQPFESPISNGSITILTKWQPFRSILKCFWIDGCHFVKNGTSFENRMQNKIETLFKIWTHSTIQNLNMLGIRATTVHLPKSVIFYFSGQWIFRISSCILVIPCSLSNRIGQMPTSGTVLKPSV